jgi:hypothetical protein
MLLEGTTAPKVPEQDPLIKGIDHIPIAVKNLDSAEKFSSNWASDAALGQPP